MARRGAPKKYTKEQMASALKKHKGQIYLASKAVGCDYNTIRRYIDEYPELQEIIDFEREQMGDEVENALYEEAVKERNITALIFLAKTKFSKRGYTERHHHQIEGEMGITWRDMIERAKSEIKDDEGDEFA